MMMMMIIDRSSDGNAMEDRVSTGLVWLSLFLDKNRKERKNPLNSFHCISE